MKKNKIGTFQRWAVLNTIWSSTLTFGEYCLISPEIHKTPFGKKLLNFFWCKYIEQKIQNILIDGRKIVMDNNQSITVYYCVPGTIPGLFIRKKY